jgi:beta-lactamase regulating signal transducer with metallopeptidase domain/type II secretory pathway component GspD/PulD (secretin)
MMFDAVIETLNLWGAYCARIAWPLFWQSSLLIAGMFLLDLLLRRRLRASVRHALWLVVLVKLLLPPSFALPSGIGWWLRPRQAAPAKPPVASYVVTYGSFHEPRSSRREEAPSSFLPVLPSVRLSTPARALLASAAISATLMVIMLMRWRCLRFQLRESQPAPIWLQEIVFDAQQRANCRRAIRLMLADASISPALCGLFRPVIVLPAALVQHLRLDQLRAVLLHELFHLRNGDVWINCFQSLLQIVFWWHPFLWLANSRIRRVREEVVDDAVRLALGEEAESYAPTLLEVARLALARPLATLGLVGILESRHALKQRVDRLVNFPAPRRAGLSIISGFVVMAFASVALPMGQAPPKVSKPTPGHTPTLYYSFDQSFVDYFGSNGVDAVTQALARNDSVSNLSRYRVDSPQQPLDSRGLDIQAGLSTSPGFDAAIVGNTGSGAIADSAWEIKPLSENGWVDFNFASGITTATNGAILTYRDTSISADTITLNRETGEIVAEGSVKLKMGADIPLGGILHGNITNWLFAQNQPSVIGSSRIPQTASGRRGIRNKLEAIRLNNVTFDNLPLSEVVNYLRDEARKRDPEGKGINFLINPNADMAGLTGPTAIDPATGLQVTPQVEPADINSVSIRILPSLNDVRMIDVLDAIVKVADKRIRFSIEDYGVAFRLAGNESPVPLFTRTIKVDPNVFAQGLESVVGISVGNFQTGGQGGGGQQGNNSVTVPRVQVAPNGIGAQAGQSGAGGAQGGGGISGVTRPTTMISPQAVRQFLANAGVDLTPQKYAVFNDRTGTLLVHATKDDLDIIERAVGALSTRAAQPATTRISETPSNPVPPATNQAKLPILGDLPVVGRVFTRTVEVVSAASPATSESYTNQNSDAKLLTRVIKVEPGTFRESVRKYSNLPNDASSQDVMNAFRKMLLDSGLELLPPKNVFYNEHGASLLVRATAQDLEFIESFIQVLNLAPPQINIRAKFIELSEADAKLAFSALKEFPSSNSGSSTTTNSTVGLAEVLSEPQFRVILHALEQRDTVDLRSESSVTTLSGRQVQIQNVDTQSIVSLNRQALTSPGVTSSNLLQTTSILSGPVLDIIQVVKPDGMTVALEATATVTEFLGYDQPPKGDSTFVYVDGKTQSITPPLPHIRVRSLHNSAKLYDGQTLMLGMASDVTITYDKDGKATTHPSETRKELLVFVTATIIDLAGNPIHSGDPLLLVPDQR